MLGAEKYQRVMRCEACDGDGVREAQERGQRDTRCPECEGTGEVDNPDYDSRYCPDCGAFKCGAH